MWTVRRALTRLGVIAAHPLSFVILAVYVVLWFIFERETFDWHAVATICTWAMTLLIQRAEHRDTQAIHAKLDELLRASGTARTILSEIDKQEPEKIQDYRAHERRRT